MAGGSTGDKTDKSNAASKRCPTGLQTRAQGKNRKTACGITPSTEYYLYLVIVYSVLLRVFMERVSLTKILSSVAGTGGQGVIVAGQGVQFT